MPTALLILDMQKYFFQTKIKRARYPQLISSINALIQECDKKEDAAIFNIISLHKADRSTWSRNMILHDTGCLLEGTQESEIVEDLQQSSKQIIIPKTRHSAFMRTDLEQQLLEKGIKRIIISGVYTHGCVALTAIDAWSLDFEVVIASDGIFSHRSDLAEFCIERLQNMFHIPFLSNTQLIEQGLL